MLDTVAMEDMHIAFLSAMCADAQVRFDLIRHDETSVDGELRKKVTIGNVEVEVTIHIQLKSTCSGSQYTERDDYISYKLKAKNYNDMCAKRTIPLYLGLLILPPDSNDWLSCSDEELRLKGRMFVQSFASAEETTNQQTKNVHIYKQNFLTPNSLSRLMESVAREIVDHD